MIHPALYRDRYENSRFRPYIYILYLYRGEGEFLDSRAGPPSYDLTL